MDMQLVKRKGSPHFTITITADSNDADYLTEKTVAYGSSLTENQEKALRLLKEKAMGSHGLEEFSENDKDFQLVWNVLSIPSTEFGVCHTIESIDITYQDADGIMYDVIL